MAENDNRSVRVADSLFDNEQISLDTYFRQEQTGPNFTAAFEIAEGIFISDVTDHATRLYRQAAFFEGIGEKMPCISMGAFEYAPIEVFPPPVLFADYVPYYLSELRYYWREVPRLSQYWARLAKNGAEVRFFAPREALQFIRRGVSRFLSSRFLGATPTATYAPVPFTLHNQNPNHQIYYSSPYYFQTSNVFGGPSTPVTQNLHPGIYVFGVMGPVVHNNYTPQFETTSHFDIPRLHTSGTLVTI